VHGRRSDSTLAGWPGHGEMEHYSHLAAHPSSELWSWPARRAIPRQAVQSRADPAIDHPHSYPTAGIVCDDTDGAVADILSIPLRHGGPIELASRWWVNAAWLSRHRLTVPYRSGGWRARVPLRQLGARDGVGGVLTWWWVRLDDSVPTCLVSHHYGG
jgi:hypothetical protein